MNNRKMDDIAHQFTPTTFTGANDLEAFVQGENTTPGYNAGKTWTVSAGIDQWQFYGSTCDYTAPYVGVSDWGEMTLNLLVF